ncbi:hypothetical protein PIB30_050376 [Stylosanthes scabra]|uniref:Uncharacterized protein n=1 Tax=Stylosanthes scabra TaxID=79078 RepID=A0ABU6RHN3_9FABA|nr:hypothetical protein [Stylosanthes scabra]
MKMENATAPSLLLLPSGLPSPPTKPLQRKGKSDPRRWRWKKSLLPYLLGSSSSSAELSSPPTKPLSRKGRV